MENKKNSLVEWIKENGLTVDYFACKLKVDKSYIYKLDKGEIFPSNRLMAKIKKATLGYMEHPEDIAGE